MSAMRSAAVLALGLTLLGACERRLDEEAAAMTGGDPARGVRAIQSYGCGGCHEIPGVAGAGGLVGPPLTRIASRVYLAGRLPNSPDNLIRWIRHPQQLEPGTAMPDMGIDDRDARDIAAYLYTLR